MPYRRLPNTDSARIKALRTAIEKADETDFQQLAFSPGTLARAKNALLQFERLCAAYQQTYGTQVKANKSFQAKAKNTRMYISHFMQVLYMCVMRAEIKEEHLRLYGLENANMVVPDLTSAEQLLEWGQKIIDGEAARLSKGGVPVYNPSSAKVNVMYTLFKEAHQTQKLHRRATSRMLDQVSKYRDEVDAIIFDIWEDVEKRHMAQPFEQRLRSNREYGVVYYYRKGETVE